jgi:hypothetical protein
MSMNQEALAAVLADHQAQVAEFARTSYEADGRGAVRVEFPLPRAGATIVSVTEMVYHTLEELRGLLAADDADQAVLLKMVETYDPTTQAVVVAAFTGGNPISVEMRLEPPTMVDGAEGVH